MSTPRLSYGLSGPAQAPAVVFVNGLGGVRAGWALQERAFAVDYRVLTYDQRGVGGSEVIDQDVRMVDFAADLVALLDRVGIQRASFVGLSFGGRVLQELALGWPERVERLIVGGTSCGASSEVPGDPEALAAMQAAPDLDEDAWVARVVPALFGPDYVQRHPRRVRSFARWRVRNRPDPVGIARQWQAWQGFDACDRLAAIRCPVWVLHGTADRLVPVENGRQLARGVQDGHFVPLEGLGHAPNVEDPARFNAAVRVALTGSC